MCRSLPVHRYGWGACAQHVFHSFLGGVTNSLILLHVSSCKEIWWFLSIFNDFDYRYGARSDQIVPLEYFTMSKSCSEGLIYLVTIVVCSHRPWFQSISTHFEVSVVLIMKLFPHTLWGTQIPWFWALFEPPKIAHTQLQAPAEIFLEVVWS